MMWKQIFLILNIALAFGSGEYKKRTKRYLVYPDGGPARTQFIIGLGIPVDLKEQSVTVGTVIKFQYDLPTNSTEYSSRIYGFANTVSRNMVGDAKENADTDESERRIDNVNDLEHLDKAINDTPNDESDSETSEEDENTLLDITFDRRKRALMYSEGGVILQNGITTTEIPLEEAIRRQEEIDKKYQEENMQPNKANRWDFYKILEHMAERYGYSGRPCLLRSICEAAYVPFTHENGLLGEIGHILFTPSSTTDALSHHTDNEYHAAEQLGKEIGADCENLFPECESSVLETFTEIGIDTLHKFGLA